MISCVSLSMYDGFNIIEKRSAMERMSTFMSESCESIVINIKAPLL